MKKQEQILLGIVMERHKVDNPWTSHTWRTVTVIPGAPKFRQWQEMAHAKHWTRFFAGSLPLRLHRGETEGYRVNLSQAQPSVYVVLRNVTDERPLPFLVTACPFEAEDYEVSGEERTDRVTMPREITALVGHFIEAHHVEEKFIKRQRSPHKSGTKTFPSERLAGKRYG